MGARATCSRCRSRTARSTRRRSASASATSPTSSAALAELRRVLRRRRPRRRSSRSRSRAGLLAPFYRLWFDRHRAAARQAAAGRRRLHVPPGERAPLPRARTSWPALMREAGFAGRRLAHLRGRDRRAAHRGRRRDRARRRSARRPGSTSYLEELEERLDGDGRAPTPGSSPRSARTRSRAGGKRLRPLLVFLCAPPDGPPPLAAGVAVELVHMATLVHDDLIDGAEFRRGRASAWSALRPRRRAGDRRLPLRPRVRRARGDRRRARRRAASPTRRSASPAARRCSARQTHDPDTTRRGLPRALRAEDREAVRGGVPARRRRRPGLGAFGLALGIAFQIADDILDCAGETIETGKIAGIDLREGTPTLPLILAAREDEVVRARARRRPARRRARPRRRDGRARAARARSRSTTRAGRARASTASSIARSSRPSPTLVVDRES